MAIGQNIPIIAEIEAGTNTYQVELPMGVYRIGLTLVSDITGASTTAEVRHRGVATPLGVIQDNLSGVGSALAVATAPFNVTAEVYPHRQALAFKQTPSIQIFNGLDVVVDQGAAVVGETYELTLTAHKIR